MNATVLYNFAGQELAMRVSSLRRYWLSLIRDTGRRQAPATIAQRTSGHDTAPTASSRSTGTRRRGAFCSSFRRSTPTSSITSRRRPARVGRAWAWTAASTRRRSCTSSGSDRRCSSSSRTSRYRALNGSAALKENVRDSFATSVLASLPIEAEEGERVLVDATSLVVRDATGAEAALRQAAGNLPPRSLRSSVYLARTKAFPKNTEIEAILTFDGDNPGILVDNVTPEPSALTLRQHHSFVEAPTGYIPRVADPRVGNTALTFRISQHPSTLTRR